MSQNTIKILFIIPTLMAGGAERIMTFLSKNLDDIVFDSTLIVIGSQQGVSYDIKNMKIKFLNENRVSYAIPNLIRCIYNEKPHIVMGTVSHLNLVIGLISYLFPKIIFLGRQAAISKISTLHHEGRKNYVFDMLLNNSLRKLDYVICQSKDMFDECREGFNIKENKLKIIRNPITDNFKINKIIEIKKNNLYKFISVGRLVKIKGHERILEVLSNFKLPFSYTIVGNGPKKEDILEKIDSLGLKDHVKFIDFTNDVPKYLAQSDYYLQGSYSEGFPNALLESCAVGTPAIAFDVPGGTKEIIENGINGFLVDTEDEFLERLNNLPTFNPKSVSESVYKKFDKKIILSQYEQFFMEIVKK